MDFLPLMLQSLIFVFNIYYPGLIPKELENIVNNYSDVVGSDAARETVEDIESKVIRVVDGDTIVLETGETVRYIGVNAPETYKNKECYADEAKNYNKNLVEGKLVKLEKDKSETDRYGRLLRYVYVGETMVNEQLVSQGYAIAKAYPPDVKYKDLLKETELKAKREIKGLWKECT